MERSKYIRCIHCYTEHHVTIASNGVAYLTNEDDERCYFCKSYLHLDDLNEFESDSDAP